MKVEKMYFRVAGHDSKFKIQIFKKITFPMFELKEINEFLLIKKNRIL